MLADRAVGGAPSDLALAVGGPAPDPVPASRIATLRRSIAVPKVARRPHQEHA